jgi:predicted outer membrane repeat protein
MLGEKEGGCVIDCNFKGRLFNVEILSSSVSGITPAFSMTNISIVNGFTSTVDQGGAAVAISAGCSLFLRRCHFANHSATNINSLPPPAQSDSKIQGGGAIFIDLAEGAELLVTESSFDNCSATGRGFATMGGGLCVQLAGGNAAATAEGAVAVAVDMHVLTQRRRWVRIHGSTFTGCAAAFGGGAFVGSGLGVAVEGMDIRVQASEFQHCTAHAGSGGGIAIYFYTSATNVEVSFLACQIMGNTAAGEFGYAQGGGAYYKVYEAAVNTSLRFTACQITQNIASGGAKGNQGGGFLAYFMKSATNTSVVVTDTSIVDNTAGGVAGYALGGGIYVGHGALGGAIRTSMVFVRCTFSGNAALGAPNAQGAGLTVLHLNTTTDTSLVVIECSFRDNIVTGGKGMGTGGAIGFGTGGAISLQYSGGSTNATLDLTGCIFERNMGREGGAVYHLVHPPTSDTFSTTSPPSLRVRDCTFVANTALQYGGAIYAEQSSIPLPANLVMHVDFDLNDAVPRKCTANFSGIDHAREWQPGTSEMRIIQSEFTNNTAAGLATDPSDSAFGGAIHVANVRVTIYNSTISGNSAVEENAVGGGISLGPGIASLVLVDTVMNDNTCSASNGRGGGSTGATIYSASGGAITLQGQTRMNFAAKATGADMVILRGGRLVYGAGTKLACPVGHTLEYDIKISAQNYEDWKIDCSAVRSDDQGTATYANPTCEQLRLNSSLPVLYTHDCQQLPLAPPMLMTAGTVLCRPCAPSLYSFDRSIKHGNITPHTIHCLPCPYGANCTEGGAALRVKTGFWAQRVESRSTEAGIDTALPRAELQLCPADYCCADGANGCVWDGDEACLGHRNRSLPLCGGCQHGFSQSIDGVQCVQDIDCGGKSAAAYVMLQLLYWCMVAAYGLYTARYPLVLSVLPRRLRPAERNNGGVSAVLYFLQMAMVAVPQGYRTLVAKVATAAGNVANIQQLSSGQGVCLLHGMTMVHRLVWQLFAPLMPMLTLALFVLILGVRGRFASDKSEASKRTSFVSHLHGPGSSRSSVGSSRDFSQDCNSDCDDSRTSSGGDGSGGGSGGGVSGGGVSGGSGGGIVAGVACLMLLSFSSFSTAALKLLNCKRMAHGQRVLFFAGATECGVWQVPIYLLLTVLVLVPLSPVCISGLRRLPSSWWLSRWARTRRWSSHSVLRAIRQHALEPFEHKQRHWAAVLMLQRLLTVACHSLASSELETELGVTIVSVWFLLLQAIVKPYRVQWVNTLQLVAGWCLVMLSVLNSASNSVFVSLGVDVLSTPFQLLGSTANILMFALLWPPLLMLSVFTVLDAGRSRTLRLRGRVEGECSSMASAGATIQDGPDQHHSHSLTYPLLRDLPHGVSDGTMEMGGGDKEGHARLVERQQQLDEEKRQLEQELDTERKQHALEEQNMSTERAAEARRNRRASFG